MIFKYSINSLSEFSVDVHLREAPDLGPDDPAVLLPSLFLPLLPALLLFAPTVQAAGRSG